VRALLAGLLLLVPLSSTALELGASGGAAHLTQAGSASGFAGDLRFGGTGRVDEVEVTSEVGLLFARLGDATSFGGLGGWRLRFGKAIRPGAIVHLGLGHYHGEGLAGFTDLMWQVGGLVDFVPLPGFTVGLQVEYTGFLSGAREVVEVCGPGDPRCTGNTGPSPNWLSYGLHVAVRL
jgi:hypothetical protein